MEAALRRVGRTQSAGAAAAAWVSFLPREIPPFHGAKESGTESFRLILCACASSGSERGGIGPGQAA